MSTVAQTINERHLHEGSHRRRESHGSGRDVAESIGLFLVTPFVALAFAVFYGLFGLAAVACYGLKAFGIRCGVFSR
jgi:hypothetical protein